MRVLSPATHTGDYFRRLYGSAAVSVLDPSAGEILSRQPAPSAEALREIKDEG